MEIEEIVIKSISQQLSLENEIILNDWLEQNKNNREIYDELQHLDILLSVQSGAENQTDHQKELHKLHQAINAYERKRKAKKISIAVSIVAAILFLTLLAYDLTKTEKTHIQEYEFIATSDDIVVDTLIGNGTVKAYMLTTEGIIKLNEENINLSKSRKKQTNTVSHLSVYNTISVPEKGQFYFVMEDSTKVWLNGGSSITYPIKFATNEREVLLSGEAYFDVTSNSSRPFIVKSKSTESVVYGTKINVNAYKTSKYVSTTLFSGKVRVNNVEIQPGEMAVKQDNSSEVIVNKVDLRSADSWLRGEFYFDGTRLEHIMEQIAQWYGKKIIYHDEIAKNEIFTLILSRNNSLEHVLEMLAGTEKVTFKITHNNINIQMR